jgi:lysophospholipase L1-like esterase
MLLKRIILIALPFVLTSCSESTTLSPTAPTSPSAEKVQALTISCPVDAIEISPSGVDIQIIFTQPVIQGGLEPIISSCSPESGANFPLGTTTVTCNAQDKLRQTTSCSLSISVKDSLGINRIVAFGDSITRGVMSGLIAQFEPIDSLFDPANSRTYSSTLSYPIRLRVKLDKTFGNGSIQVFNEGRDGAGADDSFSRFRQTLRSKRPDAMLLMLGSNDIFSGTTDSFLQSVSQHIERMVIESKHQGSDVFLATIPPQRGATRQSTAPQRLNAYIKNIAMRQNVTLVDIYTLLNETVCTTEIGSKRVGACIGNDGLHPTAEGNQLIAEEFFDRLLSTYISTSTSTTSPRMRALFKSRGY